MAISFEMDVPCRLVTIRGWDNNETKAKDLEVVAYLHPKGVKILGQSQPNSDGGFYTISLTNKAVKALIACMEKE